MDIKMLVMAVVLPVVTGCVTSGQLATGEPADVSTSMAVTRHREELPERLDTFEDYLIVALARNPALRVARHRWEAARTRIPQARSLPDPVLSAEYMIEQHDTRYQVSLMQRIPLAGKRRLSAAAAGEEALAAWYSAAEAQFDLYDMLARAFYEYDYLRQRKRVTHEAVRLLATLTASVEARYQAGEVALGDLIRLRVEHARLADTLAGLEARRPVLSARLAALLDLPDGDPLPWPVVEPLESNGPLDEQTLLAMLEDLNPELKAAVNRIAAARHREALARRDWVPDLTLGAGVMVMPGMDDGDETDVGLMAGINLPVWGSRIRGARDEARANRLAAEAERDAVYQRVRSSLSEAVFAHNDAVRRFDLYRETLLPEARQALASATQAYAAGDVGVVDLVDAQRVLLYVEIGKIRARADQTIALADIGCCVGTFFAAGDAEGNYMDGQD